MITGYAPQNGRSLKEKQSPHDELKCVWHMYYAGHLGMCMDDLTGHVGRHIDGLHGVHGGFGQGQRKLEGRMPLEFCLEK